MRGLFKPTALLLCALVPAAHAEPAEMVVTWTTWMRAAPSDQSRALDEIGTGVPVQVLACQDGWCRIREERADGYVQQRYLAHALTPLQPGAGACFPAQYYTAEGPLPLTICPAKAVP